MDRPWGKWTRLYADEQVELRLLEVVEGGYCTLHYHEHQANVFFVLQGKLLVQFYARQESGDILRAEHSCHGQAGPGMCGPSTTVPAGAEWIHRFHAKTPVVAYELLVVTGDNPLDPNDSVKLGEAGVGEPNP
jgi:mannose-6-phosphate isomerase-like protein (cupin superfamily)